jgi:hypothetical protein
LGERKLPGIPWPGAGFRPELEKGSLGRAQENWFAKQFHCRLKIVAASGE